MHGGGWRTYLRFDEAQDRPRVDRTMLRRVVAYAEHRIAQTLEVRNREVIGHARQGLHAHETVDRLGCTGQWIAAELRIVGFAPRITAAVVEEALAAAVLPGFSLIH